MDATNILIAVIGMAVAYGIGISEGRLSGYSRGYISAVKYFIAITKQLSGPAKQEIDALLDSRVHDMAKPVRRKK